MNLYNMRTLGGTSLRALTTEYNGFGKVTLIEDFHSMKRQEIAYGPDLTRWVSGELSFKKIEKISKRIGKEIWNGVKDFARDPFTYTYHVAKNVIKLSYYGLLFKGNKRQILSRLK